MKCNLAPLPDFILDKIRAFPGGKTSEAVNLESMDEHAPESVGLEESIPAGSRNDTLFKHAALLRSRGWTVAQISHELHKVNAERCSPPLSKDEVNAIRDSVDRFPRGATINEEFGSAPAATRSSGKALQLVSLSDVEYVPPRFLFEPYIPEGALTMIQGNPGDGKTAFLFKLAALLSKGEALLGKPCKAGNSLLISVEDSASALRGRFDASGGDAKKASLVDADQLADVNFLTPDLERVIRENNIRLLAFDPLQAFLGSGVDINKANETRPLLANLAAVADRTRCSVVLIAHMGKGYPGKLAIHGSLGSVDIAAAARSIIQIGRSAKDPDERIAVHVKASGSAQGQSISFRIGARGGVTITGASDAGIEDLLTVNKKTRIAAQGFPAEALIEACKKVLAEHPEGRKVTYEELGIAWPEGVKPKTLLDTLRYRIETEGISVTTGLRTPQGNAVLITPFGKADL